MAAHPTTGTVVLSLYNGARQLFPSQTPVLLTVRDGAQHQIYRDTVAGPVIHLDLPFHNNALDDYTVLAFLERYHQAGFHPVRINPQQPAALDLMLVPQGGKFHFAHARWTDLVAQRPLTARTFAASTPTPAETYGALLEQNPDRLACLLNLTTAMEQIPLSHQTPLDYFKTFDLPHLAPDRLFGYADAALVDQVRLAAREGRFQVQPTADLLLHTDATSSFKQIQFGEANVQLTFHEKNRQTIGGVDCVYVEPDIDYYRDPAAHLLLEVLPNGITGHVSNPQAVYVLRWIAGRHANLPEFDPLYTIE